MSNLLAGSLSIVLTSNTIKDEIKKGLGASVNVVIDIKDDEMYLDADEYQDNVEKVINELEYLIDDERVLNGEYHILNNGVHRAKEDTLYFDFCGTNISETNDFIEGHHTLSANKSVRYFTIEEIDSGEYVALVDMSLATKNDFGELVPSGLTKTGDIITLSIPVYQKDSDDIYYHDVEVKVIGSFTNKLLAKGAKPLIYVPNKALYKMCLEAVLVAKQVGINASLNFEIGDIDLTLKEIDTLEGFDYEATKRLDKLGINYKYSSSDDVYKRNAGPIENLDTVAKVIFVGAILATVLVLGLVIVSMIIERKKEIGIYASIGEKKHNIVLQMMCEIMLIATIAISFASISGIYLGNELSDYMLEVQRYTKRNQELGVLAKLPVLYTPVEDGLTYFTRDEVIDNYEISPDMEYFGIMFMIGELTVMLSSVLPMVYLINLKPKDIML